MAIVDCAGLTDCAAHLSRQSLGYANVVLAENRVHTIRIEYVAHPSNLLISFDRSEAPVISLPISIGKVLRLEGGRAWLGFVGCTPPPSAPAAAASAAGVGSGSSGSGSGSGSGNAVVLHTAITGWEFTESHVAQASIDAWRNLRMDYQLSPPLDLILTRSELDRYNNLFRFLFDVKRVSFELQQLWCTQQRWSRSAARSSAYSTTTGGGGSGSGRLQHRIQCIRQQMQHWIDALQYHLQHDVIAVTHQKLLQQIQELKVCLLFGDS